MKIKKKEAGNGLIFYNIYLRGTDLIDQKLIFIPYLPTNLPI